MAVPKCKTSKAKKHSRGAHYTASSANLVVCASCGEYKVSHQVCPNCGKYDGKAVVNVEEKKKD